MKRRNGKYCRKFKTRMGRVYWVEMKPAEVAEVYAYRLSMVLCPLLTLLAFAWAAGVLK